MTGGALKQKTTSLLSRKGELEEFKEKLVDMEEKTSKLEKQVKQLKRNWQMKNRLETLRQKWGSFTI